MNQKITKETTKVAGREYDVSDYQKNDSLSAGLAETHEQVSDSYAEGEIQPTIPE